MDGVETIERVWELDSHVQTVICTAYADYRWEDLAKKFGQTDRLLMLKKPFHDIEVMQLASTLMQKWFLARQAAMQFEQTEALVVQRTQKLLEFHRREHQQIRELDQTKLRHLAKLADEFRGPLAVMLHSFENTGAGTPLNQRALELVQQNIRMLLQMVDDSLSMRRFELEDRQLDWRETEIVGFLRGLVQMFAAGAHERRIEMNFEPEANSKVIWTDPVKLEKALFNILASALAAAADRSVIEISLHFGEATLNLEVGAQQRAQLFSERPGLEVGILLSQEILRLLGGGLTVEALSPVKEGEPSALRMRVTLAGTKPESPAADTASHTEKNMTAPNLPAGRDWPVILLIEENADIRTFICQGLAADYSFLETAEAAQGMAAARENVPDLIVVGGLSHGAGVNVCAELKRAEMTSHIPVILLATDDSDAGQVRALEAGVDDFLGKPFRLPLLKARVDNLLENRRKLHEHFQQLQTVQPRELATNQVDAEFLRRVVEIVEKNLADYEFDVESLARQLALSRRQLFRKFKAVAGCTPNVFIRDIRLKRAAQLLRDSGMTVSEIIYAVGFSDPKYFRNIFRERFGALPGEYNKQTKSAV
jgi:AraC-like DNA-binding protein